MFIDPLLFVWTKTEGVSSSPLGKVDQVIEAAPHATRAGQYKGALSHTFWRI